ncbi:GNAT family N-acetyltransferase [Tropicimonas aquimaris]|uniref:GNAT family N-acetyltransferase n=1 Tax=Tropicimonas aquimaris TaxID=914152 RepID=A0ABW3IL88_9RHOB
MTPAGLTFTIPTLETERLVLRLPRVADYPDFEAFMHSDRSRFVGGPQTDRWQSWRAFAHLTSMWLLRGYGIFAMERRDTGAVIGSVGPWEPITWPERELSWSIWSAADEGRGYVTEAMRAVHAWVFDGLGWDTCVSYVDPENHRSAAVAQRLGAVLDPDAPRPAEPLDDAPLQIWRHRRGTA